MSVLPLLCKVLERQAFNELCNYLTEHDLDTENQSGFPKYRSCQSLLIKVTDFLLGSIDSGKIAAWFVYDISKESLWSCWSPNTPRKGRVIRPRYDSGSLVSIESYLSDRYFQVKIGKVLSSKMPLQYDLESPGISTRPPYSYNLYERSPRFTRMKRTLIFLLTMLHSTRQIWHFKTSRKT